MHPLAPPVVGGNADGVAADLVAYRLAGLSAHEADYAGIFALMQSERAAEQTQGVIGLPPHARPDQSGGLGRHRLAAANRRLACASYSLARTGKTEERSVPKCERQDAALELDRLTAVRRSRSAAPTRKTP